MLGANRCRRLGDASTGGVDMIGGSRRPVTLGNQRTGPPDSDDILRSRRLEASAGTPGVFSTVDGPLEPGVAGFEGLG